MKCQCLANRFYGDPAHSQATCETVICQPLPPSCIKPTNKPNQCCPFCEDIPQCTGIEDESNNGIRITNCPSSTAPIQISLPDNLPQVIHDFQPIIEDCRGLNRNYKEKRDPMNTLFGIGSHTISVTASADRPNGGQSDISKCQFKIEVVGKIDHISTILLFIV